MIIKEMFFTYLPVSIIMSLFVICLCIASKHFNKVYTSGTKYYIWLIMAVYLIIPLHISVPDMAAPIEVVVSDSDSVAVYSRVTDAKEVIIGNEENKSTAVDTLSSEMRQTKKSFDWIGMFAIIWIAGGILSIMYEIGNYLHYRKNTYRWSKRPENVSLILLVEKLVADMGIRQNVTILICDKVHSPLMLGLIRPYIYLPHEEYSESELEFILRHELTHCKRKDLWYKFILVLARSIHWYNPVIWFMCRQANADIERFCDDAILNGREFEYRKAYSEIVLATMKRQREIALASYFYGEVYSMKERFKNILDTKKKKKGNLVLCALCLGVIAVNSLVGCSTNSASAGNPSREVAANTPGYKAPHTETLTTLTEMLNASKYNVDGRNLSRIRESGITDRTGESGEESGYQPTTKILDPVVGGEGENAEIIYTVNEDGTFSCEGKTYAYKLALTGKDRLAESTDNPPSTMIVLTNDLNLTWNDIFYALIGSSSDVVLPAYKMLGWIME